jgi:hypothetical protein
MRAMLVAVAASFSQLGLGRSFLLSDALAELELPLPQILLQLNSEAAVDHKRVPRYKFGLG